LSVVWSELKQLTLKRLIGFCIFLCFLSAGIPAIAQSEAGNQERDSLETPFKKKIWLTGIAGSISSGTALTDTTSQRIFNNSFGINLSTGRFIRDRWMIGAIFRTSRQNSEQFVIRESESLFVGPLVQHYVSDNEIGSLFFSLAPGYASFRESIELNRNGVTLNQKASGSGFGMLLGIGYSYVLHRRIAFDIRMNLFNSWLSSERSLQPSGDTVQQNVQLGDLSFSFGFNVLLDSFFF